MTLALRQLSACEKPREKFLDYGPDGVSTQDLLAILLRTGLKGESVLDLARTVIRSLPNENICHLGSVSVADLCRIRGIGRDKAVTVCAAVELGKRIAKEHVKQTTPDFSSPRAIADYVMEDMRYLQQEQFTAVYLSTKNKLIAVRTITVGTLNASLAKGRDVFRYALQYNAAAIVLLHNHPSGDPAPSQDDIRVTRQIADAGRVMEIPVLDHIIIGDGIYTSLCEQGYL